MKEDLKILMFLEDDFIFLSNSSNEFICKTDDEKEYNILCKQFITNLNTMNKIFKITYWTISKHKFWDQYFCKSPTSTAKKIKELLKDEDDIKQKDIKHISSLVLFNLLQHPQRTLNIYCGDETDWRLEGVYITIVQEELY